MEQFLAYNQILVQVYRLLVAASAIYALHTFPKGGTPFKLFRLFLLTGAAIELAGILGVQRTGSNAWVYLCGAILSFLIIALYYWFLSPMLRRGYVLLLWMMVGIVIGSCSLAMATDLSIATMRYLLFMGLSIAVLAMVFLYDSISKEELVLTTDAHPWISLLLLLNWMALLCCFGILQVCVQYAPERIPLISSGILIVNIVYYTCALLILHKFVKQEAHE